MGLRQVKQPGALPLPLEYVTGRKDPPHTFHSKEDPFETKAHQQLEGHVLPRNRLMLTNLCYNCRVTPMRSLQSLARASFFEEPVSELLRLGNLIDSTHLVLDSRPKASPVASGSKGTPFSRAKTCPKARYRVPVFLAVINVVLKDC